MFSRATSFSMGYREQEGEGSQGHKTEQSSVSDISPLDGSHYSPHHGSQERHVEMGCTNPPQNTEGTEKPFFPAGEQSSTKPSLRLTPQSPTQSSMSCNSTVLQNLLEKSCRTVLTGLRGREGTCSTIAQAQHLKGPAFPIG